MISKTHYAGAEHLGSIREVVGDDGLTVAARLDYDAWGNITSETNGAGNAATVFSDFTYTGHFRHAYAPHLVMAMCRAYSPETGRWISRDWIEEMGDLNLYGYVTNDLINKTDPNGLWAISVNVTGGFIGGAGFSVSFGSFGYSFGLAGGLTTLGATGTIQFGTDPASGWGVNLSGNFGLAGSGTSDSSGFGGSVGGGWMPSASAMGTYTWVWKWPWTKEENEDFCSITHTQ